jgi:hypothetical protein
LGKERKEVLYIAKQQPYTHNVNISQHMFQRKEITRRGKEKANEP